ncbi:Alpha/beta hydrolase fold-1 [Hypoxylon sp. FL0890]|nr:Alpha/beta hydrolase fold-1 [Hypoxylon sp. FL0890]
MNTTVKPTIIILHGGWHVPESYAKLIDALKPQGYEVHAPRLPSTNGTRPPNADLFTDSLLVRSYVESLVRAGRTVVTLMHSYGGHVGTNSLYGLGTDARQAQGLRGGMSHLIYMTGYVVPEDVSMMDKAEEFGHTHLVPLVFDFTEDDTCLFRDPKGVMVGTGPDEKEIEEYLATFVRWNGKCMYQAGQHAAWREIPVSYIYTTLDSTVPLDYQKSFVEGLEKAGCKVQTFELATNHCPHFTATEGVVSVVNKVISG